MTDQPQAASRSYQVLVNKYAGAVLEVGEEVLGQRLAAAFAAAGAQAEVHMGGCGELGARLGGLVDPMIVPVIVGGDGTVLALLRGLLDRGLPFAVLPMGTMNLLGRDLGLIGDLAADVRALHTGATRSVDLPTLNGVPFHSVSGLGFAVVVANERERARARLGFSRVLATFVAAIRALRRSRPIEVEVEVEGHSQRFNADAVLVTNNVFEGSPWRRPRLDQGILEVHLLAAPGFWARSGAALAVMTGEWRGLSHLTSLRATSLTLRRPGRRRTRVTLDGEVTWQEGVLAYALVPGALRILAAEPEVSEVTGKVMTDRQAIGA